MINCNKNQNDKGNKNHTNKTYIDQGVDIETNIEDIVCLSKMMFHGNKQHLSNIWGSFC